jgi:hypothetical protein
VTVVREFCCDLVIPGVCIITVDASVPLPMTVVVIGAVIGISPVYGCVTVVREFCPGPVGEVMTVLTGSAV